MNTTTPRISFEAIREAVQRQIAAADRQLVKGNTRLIGVAIAWYLDRREPGGKATVDEETLAADTAMTVRSVKRAVARLEARKHYRVRRSRKPDGTQATNQYFPILHSDTINWPGVSCDTRHDDHRVTDGVTAGCQTESLPGDTAVSPLPPSTSYRPPIGRAAPNGAALHTNGSANSAKRGSRGNGGTLHPSDNPSSLSQRSHRGSRLPEDWTPSPADLDFARGGLTAEALGVEAEKFRDYWIAAPGRQGLKRDWSATWRNWCRRVRGWAPGKPAEATKPPLTPDQIEGLFERYRRKQGLTVDSSSAWSN